MRYKVEIRAKVLKALARIPRTDRARIEREIESLADNPRPSGCRPVETAEPNTYRVRCGRYRIIYIVLDEQVLILVVRVGKRGEDTYKGLN